MAKIPVPNWQQAVQRGKAPLSDAANGTVPNAPGIRQIADYVNMLNARRGRILFARTQQSYSGVAASGTDNTTHKFAFHTGPLAAKVRFVGCIYKGTNGGLAASDSYGYWVLRTALTGAGSTTTQASLFGSSSGSTDIMAADNFARIEQEFDVSADTDYRLEFHQINKFTLVSLTCFEVPRSVLDSASDTNAINTNAIRNQAPITDATTASILAASEKLWKRGGHPLLYYNENTTNSSTLTSSTAVNLLDATVTAPGSNTPGFPVNVGYSGTRDSSSVAAVFWFYGATNNAAADATVTFRDQADNVIATITVLGSAGTSPTWYSATGNLTDASGGTPTTRIEVYGLVTATYQLSWNAMGAFMYTS